MADTILIAAGLDPTGGAGLVADVRVAERFGLRAAAVVTALTEQDTSGVRAVTAVAPEIVAGQLRTLLSDVEVRAVKIGALGGEKVCEALADALALTAAPVVWDPVFRPTRGAALYDGDPQRALALLRDHLAVITPNADELALLGDPAALGCPVLVTGGHAHGDRADDVLYAGGAGHEGDPHVIGGERLDTGGDVHGTGCALSTAIACRLAAGDDLLTACRAAKAFVAERLRAPETPGRGRKTML